MSLINYKELKAVYLSNVAFFCLLSTLPTSVLADQIIDRYYNDKLYRTISADMFAQHLRHNCTNDTDLSEVQKSHCMGLRVEDLNLKLKQFINAYFYSLNKQAGGESVTFDNAKLATAVEKQTQKVFEKYLKLQCSTDRLLKGYVGTGSVAGFELLECEMRLIINRTIEVLGNNGFDLSD